MSTHDRANVTRRQVVHAMLAFSAAGLVGFTGRASVRALARPDRAGLQPTPACDDGDDDATPAETEGPYFKPRSPLRTSLIEPGVDGPALTLVGRVVTQACVPVAGALLDFWQADADGRYDASGFRLRGHQYTDDLGRFSLTTVVPGLYPGRTRHLHVKVQAPNRPAVTTQLYFPDEPRNRRDPLYMRALELSAQNIPVGQSAAFTFVLATGETNNRRYNV